MTGEIGKLPVITGQQPLFAVLLSRYLSVTSVEQLQ